jgi:RNA methyltransferase, TrmH family
MTQAARRVETGPRTVTSARNPAVRAARRLAHRGPEGGTFLVEGPQAVREAGSRLVRLFVTGGAARRDPALLEAAAGAGADVIVVPPEILDELASTLSPQGVVGVASLPGVPLVDALDGATLAVVLVEARDPGNVGTVVRTADAAGADAVVLAGASVDARNAKAVRASAGSLFHLPVVHEPETAAAFAACRDAGLRLVGTDAGADERYTDADLAAPVALAFGNEAHGLDEHTLEACDKVVAVPIHGRAESLNLAATVAVVAYEAARQRAEAVVSA